MISVSLHRHSLLLQRDYASRKDIGGLYSYGMNITWRLTNLDSIDARYMHILRLALSISTEYHIEYTYYLLTKIFPQTPIFSVN
jgi:hypothetical protein